MSSIMNLVLVTKANRIDLFRDVSMRGFDSDRSYFKKIYALIELRKIA